MRYNVFEFRREDVYQVVQAGPRAIRCDRFSGLLARKLARN
jgi:hypothetical protein